MKKGKKKLLTIVNIIVLILLGISTLFIVYDLYLFTGILKFYRIMGSILIVYIAFLLGQQLICSKKKEKIRTFIIFIIISFIYSVVLSIGGYYVYRIISNLETFSKEETSYSVSLITFKDDLKDIAKLDKQKIGIIEDDKDIANYVLPKELIKEYNLDDYNQIVEYSGAIELITALYKEEVDAIFINSDFSSIYGKVEGFDDLGEKAKIIKKYKKNVKDIDPSTVVETSEKTLTEPFTILLLGVDSESDGLNPNDAFNGDTMMMLTFNPNTLQATMFSIPRDTFVPIACSGNRVNRVNTSAYGGANCVIRTLSNLTGINIDYYAMINFKGVVNLVDALGNITVDVPIEFCEQDSNRLWGKNEICLYKGVQQLNGEQALALARHRKTLALGDFQRGQHQQLVVEGMLNKLKDIRSINQVIEILDIVNKNLSTNITKEQILSFYEVGKKMILGNNTNLFNIQKTFLTGYDMSIYEPASQGFRYAFFHYKQSLNAITTAMKQNLGIVAIEPIKTFSFSINEIYERETIGHKYYSESRQQTVPSFGDINVAINWANSLNVPISIVESGSNAIITNNYDEYKVDTQSEVPGTLVLRISDIKIYVSKKNTNLNTEPSDEPTETPSTSSEEPVISTSETEE